MILKIGREVREAKRSPRNFFQVRIFSVGFKIGSKETLWSLGSERLERDGKLKLCRELP
jgi:hypothetical protein